jgi:uncharacterized protein with beta-barrel porin domain
MASTAAMADCASPVTGSQSGTCSVASGVDFVVNQGASVSTTDGTPAVAVALGTTASSVTNNGSVSSSAGDGILVNGSVSGGVSNVYYTLGSPTPTITTGLDGIHVSGGSAGWVSNDGTIVAGNGVSTYNGAPVGNGIAVDSGSSVPGGISNSGTITASGTGMLVTGSTSGSVTNDGTLQDQTVTYTYQEDGEPVVTTGPQGDGITVSSGSQINGDVANYGTIDTEGGNGVTVDASTVSGSVTNTAGITTGGTGLAILDGSQAYNVSNSGSINAETGIELANSGLTQSLVNSGSIAAEFGVNVIDSSIGGSLTNNGTISGGYEGIQVQGSTVTGTVTNALTLQAEDTGISVSAGSTVGAITNTAGATITTDGPAIQVDQSTVRTNVTNQGTLTTQDGAGIDLTSSAAASVSNSGTITSNSADGIALTDNSHLTGNLTNTGSISVGQDANGIDVADNSSVGGNIVNTSSITINTLSIDGGEGTNAGINVQSASSVVGSISNTVSGSINAQGGDGMLVSNSTVGTGISNAGQITADNGIVLDNLDGGEGTGSKVLAGGISNSGSISAAYDGIDVNNGSTVAGGITNTAAGTIFAAQQDADSSAGIDVRNGSTVSGGVTNNGVINATLDGGEGSSAGIAVVDSSTVNGGIANTGTISASNDNGNGAAIVVGTGSTVNGGIMNGVGAQLNGSYAGIYVQDATVNGDINNQGAVNGGIVVDTGTVGSITNTSGATVTGYDAVALVQSQVGQNGISNAGTLTGSTGAAVYLDNTSVAGNLSNASTGTISGATYGVDVEDASTVSGAFINNGTTTGTMAGLVVADSAIGGVSNAGQITGGANGIVLSAANVSGNVANSGTISATTGDALSSVASTITGTITNSGQITSADARGIAIDGGEGSAVGAIANQATGTIQGATDGVALTDATLTQGLTNAGTITGTSGNGVALYASTIAAGGITNASTGTISGAEAAVLVGSSSSVTGDINNAGHLNGGYVGLEIDPAASLNGNIVNSGVIGGTQGVALIDSTVSGNLTNNGTIAATAGNGILANGATIGGQIANTGTITAANGSGILLDGGEGSAQVGSISNAAGAQIVATDGVAIRAIDATVAGGITNAGTLSGIYGVYLSNATTGSLTNQAGGTITGTNGLGIATSNAQINGDITNAGSVTGSMFGIGLAETTVSGSLNNSGTLSGSGVGLYLIDGTTVAGNIVNSGSVTGVSLDASTVSGSLQNSGTINGTVSLADGAKLGGIVNTGTIAGGANGVGVNVANATLTSTIENSGTISGATAIDLSNAAAPVTIDNTGSLAGAVQLGAGTLNLNGSSSQVTGAVDGTTASTVNVNGTFATANTFNVGAINIASGATLVDQHDLTASNGVNNAGTLTVSSATPVTIHGNYTQAAGATYSMQASSPSTYSQLAVTGTANLAANTNIFVNVAGSSTLVPRGVLKGVIQAGTLNASTFNVTDNSVLFDFKGVVDDNNVDLNVINAQTVLQQTNANLNFAGSGAARTFDYLIANGASGDMNQVISALGAMTTSQQVSNAVKQTLPVLAGATAAGVTATMNDVDHVVQARQEESRGLSAGDGYAADSHLWFKPFGSWSHQDDDNGAAGFTSSTAGVVAGVDTAVSTRDRVGAAFAYAHQNQDGNDSVAPQSARTDSYQAILYGSHSLDPRTDLSWQADLGYNTTDGSRSITFTGSNLTAASSYGGWNGHVGAGIGHIFDLSSAINLTPSLRVDYTTVKNNGYTETGAGALNLNVDGQRAQELVLGGDAKLLYSVSDKFSLTANAGLGYDALAKNAVIVSSFTGGGPAFATQGVSPSHLLARGGAGVTYHGGKGWEVVGRYDVEARSRFTNQTVSVKIRKSF